MEHTGGTELGKVSFFVMQVEEWSIPKDKKRGEFSFKLGIVEYADGKELGRVFNDVRQEEEWSIPIERSRVGKSVPLSEALGRVEHAGGKELGRMFI